MAIVLVVGVSTGCGAAAPRTPVAPFTAGPGVGSGPSSGLWGDGSSGPTGLHIGCIDGRRLAVLVTVRNRTTQTVTLLGGHGQQVSPDVVDPVAVQVRPAPLPPKGDLFQPGLRSWSGRDSPPAGIPAGRSAWVQLDFLMRNCMSLGSGAVTANRSITLDYRAHGRTGAEAVTVPGARIILTRGPLHPTLPINHTG